MFSRDLSHPVHTEGTEPPDWVPQVPLLRPGIYTPFDNRPAALSQNFTLGTCCAASLALKYALFVWYPAIPAQILFGNCWMNVL
jgi:hypothetical protein